jgi:hypothetical protein
MPMVANTEVKDFTKELEVKEPATIAISGEAGTVFMNKGCQQKFFFTTLTAVEQSPFMVVSRKDKRTDVTSTTPNISLDRRIIIVIVSVFFFLLFFFASII